MEYLYRRLPGSWWQYLWVWVPCSAFISYAICQIVRQPGQPLFVALVVWSLAIMGLRVLVTTVLLHDKVAPGAWAALALLLAARIVQTVWR